MRDLPGLVLEPVSPALAGGFLTTVPPEKPLHICLWFPHPFASCPAKWRHTRHGLFLVGWEYPSESPVPGSNPVMLLPVDTSILKPRSLWQCSLASTALWCLWSFVSAHFLLSASAITIMLHPCMPQLWARSQRVSSLPPSHLPEIRWVFWIRFIEV